MDNVYEERHLLGGLQFINFPSQLMARFRFNLRRSVHTSSTFDSAGQTLNRNRYVEFSFQRVDTERYL
jgi:hypothetical protein